MPLPESFDINSFDNVDLWGVTRNLAERVPGLHVARILSPRYDSNRSMTYMRAFLCTPEANGRQIEFADADFRGTKEEMSALGDQVRLSMGAPKIFEGIIWDKTPEATSDPDLQLKTAREFLPYIGTMSVSKVVRQETDGRLVRLDAISQVARDVYPPTVQIIEMHAKVNVQLALLAGEELFPYEEIVERAAHWEPAANIPPDMSWLTGRERTR